MLQGEIVALVTHVVPELLKFLGVEFAAQARGETVMQLTARIGWLDGVIVQLLFGAGAHGCLATPPGRQGGDGKRFAQHMARQWCQEALQGGGFQKAAARAVGHDDLAGTHGLQQAGDALA